MYVVSSVGGASPREFSSKDEAIAYGKDRWGIGLYRIDFQVSKKSARRKRDTGYCSKCKGKHVYKHGRG